MKNGMKGIAITDHGNMFGVKEFTNCINKKNSPVNGEIKTLKKRLAGIQSGKIECEDKKSEIEVINNQIADAKTRLFIPIIGCEMYVARRSKEKKDGKPDRSG